MIGQTLQGLLRSEGTKKKKEVRGCLFLVEEQKEALVWRVIWADSGFKSRRAGRPDRKIRLWSIQAWMVVAWTSVMNVGMERCP